MTRRQASAIVRVTLAALFLGGGLVAVEYLDRAAGSVFILLAVAVPVLGLLFFSPSENRRRFRERHGLCLTCGYDLRAHKPGDKCPECGTVIRP